MPRAELGQLIAVQLQPRGDLLGVQLSRAKHELCIALPDGDGMRLPAELVQVTLLGPRVHERAPSPAGANTVKKNCASTAAAARNGTSGGSHTWRSSLAR